MDSREQFEKWARWSGLAFSLAWEQGRGYIDPDTWKALKSWQASREAAIEECAAALQEMKENIPTGLVHGAPVVFVIRCCHSTVLALKGDKEKP